MRVSSKETICGHPALQVRRLLRSYARGIDTEVTRAAMNIDARSAKVLIESLEMNGYIERKSGDRGYWQTTVKGNALAMASAARPLTRATADKLLVEFIARVERLRDEPHWCFKVDRVVLFGSYLSEAKLLSDIDVAVAWRPSHSDRGEQETAEDLRRDAAERAGRRFPHFVARLFWPEAEAKIFLKARTRLSIHDLSSDAPIVEAGRHVTIYAEERVCQGSIPILEDWSDERSRAVYEKMAATRSLASTKRETKIKSKIIQEQKDLIIALERVREMSQEERAQAGDAIRNLLSRADANELRVNRLLKRTTNSDGSGEPSQDESDVGDE